MKFAVATNTYFVKSLECLKREKGRKSLKLNVSTTGNQLQHDRERELVRTKSQKHFWARM